MQATTATVIGGTLVVLSSLALLYRAVLLRQAKVEVRSKRHDLGTREGGESFLLGIELPDGTVEVIDVWEHIFRRHEVGDWIGISFFQGPAWWTNSVYYGRGWASSPWQLVAPTVLVVGFGLLVWGITRLG